ncbi:polysaccharide biosynthesis protein [Petroclostridium sp. X23]|uniref:putative polysaccharide biosynthesis protein n=1 Tax=Petroclostridium sp. X23 TaxID=3045146 RepID=UPI0024ADFCE3|nr:polysaccharide biosynthesis protein [Petroclostridium sp. X23]WHH57609.1 polysaccharide biosynthesis protein [Petroclostridium sp. X23]
MGKTYKQTFLQGALILVFANATVKVIGALFKVPLTYLLGPDGMGIYGAAYEIYKWLFVIATAGLPVAVSKMVSESVARDNRREAHKVFNIAFFLLSIIGIAGTSILFFGSRFLADAFGNSRAYLAVMAMSPSLLFVAIMSAYRGYFQGLQNMIPTAVSEVVEALGKLVVGFLLAYLWVSRGVEYSSAGAILGVSTGTFLGAVTLYFIYRFSQKSISAEMSQASNTVKVRSSGQILSQLIRIAIPITLGASVFSLTSVIDAAMIMNRLQSIGFTEKEASTMYGYLSQYAVTMFSLPPTLIVAISTSIVPAIASAYAVNNLRQAKKTTESALRITLLFALPSAVGLSILSGPILQLVFHDAGAEQLLNILGYAVVFVSMVLVTNALLQATGRVMIPVRNMLIGGIIKIITNYILVGIPGMNINGAPIGTNICYFIIIVLNLIEVKKVTNANYKITDFIIKPIIAVASMAIAVIFTYNNLMRITQSNSISALAAMTVGALIYGLMLIAIGGIKRDDIEMMPKGKTLLRFFNKFGLLK